MAEQGGDAAANTREIVHADPEQALWGFKHAPCFRESAMYSLAIASMFAGVEMYRKRPPYSVNNRFLKLSVPAAEAVFFGEARLYRPRLARGDSAGTSCANGVIKCTRRSSSVPSTLSTSSACQSQGRSRELMDRGLSARRRLGLQELRQHKRVLRPRRRRRVPRVSPPRAAPAQTLQRLGPGR